MLEQSIKNLKEEVVNYASFVGKMLDKSMQGLIEKDKEILRRLLNEYEPKANDWEVKIEELCVEVIAKFEPKAKDLRIVLMILKMNNDLERMADHAVNIAESGIYLLSNNQIKSLMQLPDMATTARSMLDDSINAFVNEEVSDALDVCERDNIVDDLRDEIFRELVEEMSRHPSEIKRRLHMERIAKSLERIADLTTNICEDVIYMANGRVIKHHLENGEPPYSAK